jgi:hypothetical protein
VLWNWSAEAMELFTQHYKALNSLDYASLPYWELVAAIRPAFKIGEWATSPGEEQKMRAQLKQFVAQAYEQISGHAAP